MIPRVGLLASFKMCMVSGVSLTEPKDFLLAKQSMQSLASCNYNIIAGNFKFEGTKDPYNSWKLQFRNVIQTHVRNYEYTV